MYTSSIYFLCLESLLEIINTCYNNSKKSSTTKINKHKPSGYSLFTNLFDATKSKLDYYRGNDIMKKFCKDLREHAKKTMKKRNDAINN